MNTLKICLKLALAGIGYLLLYALLFLLWPFAVLMLICVAVLGLLVWVFVPDY